MIIVDRFRDFIIFVRNQYTQSSQNLWIFNAFFNVDVNVGLFTRSCAQNFNFIFSATGRSKSKNYFISEGHFNLLYHWTPTSFWRHSHFKNYTIQSTIWETLEEYIIIGNLRCMEKDIYTHNVFSVYNWMACDFSEISVDFRKRAAACRFLLSSFCFYLHSPWYFLFSLWTSGVAA